MIAPIESFGHRDASSRWVAGRPADANVRQRPIPTITNAFPENFITRSLRRNPTAAVASAVVVGLALGWFVKRKWNR